MRISEFLFQKGRLISLYGLAGTGKTNIALQVLIEVGKGIFISTEGSAYEARLEKLKGLRNALFTNVNSILELITSIIKSSTTDLIIIDSINSFYRLSRRKKDIEYPLILLKSFSENGGKVLLIWQMSWNNKVSGEKFMRKFSDDVLRISRGEIIGNLRVCKFKITERGVLGCL
ncbi:AAA family ATPase [Sulfolobus sp. SCGC AB-777_L09]|nr:AAA family ATPase [Sulfolobaceae archaeon]PVU71155.1 AAA family ATPase [Sulfolobus sp. SCGC AB-777_L09]